MTSRRPQAITFDFFNTLAYHRDGRGRGTRLIEYLRGEGFNPCDWRHEILYEIFDVPFPVDADRDAADRARYGARLVERTFRALEMAVPDEIVERQVEPVWEILGPAAFGVFADVQDTLGALRASGYPLAIVSNWPRGLRYFSHELRLTEHFECILASGEVGAAKPDAEIFAEAAKRLGVAPRDILHVGDSPVDDVAGATGAGFAALLLDRGGVVEQSPAAVLRGLATLPDWLRQHRP